ncbi:MAG TPA: VOC family protein [Kofleriaceae bacterium]|nr:VOC family protein [Kofleriaceae bacterium]
MQKKITTFLTFDGRAEEAVTLYTSIFPNSKITSESRYGEGAPMPKGTVIAMTFELDGVEMVALNGGPMFKFSSGVSLFVDCKTQQEIDTYWTQLTADGGAPGPCGWLTDKFGVSWQIVPDVLSKLIGDKDPARAGRAMQAMMTMQKLDIAALERAHEGGV